MLGWHISVYRQTDDGVSPATAQSPTGTRVAVWQTGLGGLEWFDELVKAGKAIDLSGDGYPSRYTAAAEYLLPQILDKPLRALVTWMSGTDDVLTEKWEGKTVVDREVVAVCRRDEWLLIEAWDES